MDPRTVIAQRIDLKLRHMLGTGVDARRTIDDERYARDVLLVCDAMVDTDLPLLARQFRAAGKLYAKEQQAARRHAPGQHPGPAQDWAGDTSGFGVSRPPPLPGAMARTGEDNRDAKPSWFSPSRWLGS
jgi:hypothetical protein